MLPGLWLLTIKACFSGMLHFKLLFIVQSLSFTLQLYDLFIWSTEDAFWMHLCSSSSFGTITFNIYFVLNFYEVPEVLKLLQTLYLPYLISFPSLCFTPFILYSFQKLSKWYGKNLDIGLKILTVAALWEASKLSEWISAFYCKPPRFFNIHSKCFFVSITIIVSCLHQRHQPVFIHSV